MDTRTEHDSMGPVEVPASAKWQAQTQRALGNFTFSGQTVDHGIVRAIAAIKAEAAGVNAALGVIDDDIAAAVTVAADAVARGDWEDEFPLDVYQTGSGTSTHMNVNEVVATLAREESGLDVHPNDHVNASQSSNDVFPSAVHIAVVAAAHGDLLPTVLRLATTIEERADEFADVVKAGRTHLMDAVPVTVGQELGGHAAQLREAAERITSSLTRTGRLPLGGTATGTGLNAPPEFGERVIARLADRFGLPLTAAPNRFATTGGRDGLVELAAQLRGLAIVLVKIGNDLRWAASGPAAGLGELRMPALQPGSSHMPGKVNPVIVEAVTQVAARVIGNDATVAFAGSQGNFEMNVYVPVMGNVIAESISLLTAACDNLATKVIAGLEVDEARCRHLAEASPALATALAPHIGYDAAASVVKEALDSGRTLRAVVLDRGLLDEATVDSVLDVRAMAEGGVR